MLDFDKTKKLIIANHIPLDKICLVGSSILSEKNIRESDDIDLIIDSNIRDSLGVKKKAKKFDNNVEIVGKNWARRMGLSDEKILKDSSFHYISNGLKLVDIDILLLNKKLMGRSKDLKDVKKISEYRKHGATPSKSIFKLLKNKKFYLKPRAVFWYPFIFYTQIVIKIKSTLEQKKILYFSFASKYPNYYLSVDLPVLISNQFINQRDFNRYDLVVRYLAVKSCMNGDNKGIELYSKMQKIRSRGRNTASVLKFRTLIENIKDIGYHKNSTVEINNKLKLLDGAHRVSCAMYFNVSEISISPNLNFINKIKKPPNYSLKWFQGQDFAKSDLEIIVNSFRDYMFKNHIYFVGIIWPPAMHLFNEIVENFKEEFIYIDWEELELGSSFDSRINELYACDDIEDWKISYKLESMRKTGTKIGILRFVLGRPDFRRKELNNQLISRKIEKIKKKYRSKYKNRVPNYVYDIILHIADNFEHTKHMENVISNIKY